jgi:hypothetical protein
MDPKSDPNSLKAAQQVKLQELHDQEVKLKELKGELEKLNSKIKNHEKLSADDTKFISELGWLSAVSVTIASIASSL